MTRSRTFGNVIDVTAQIAHHPAGIALELFQGLAHPLEFDMGVATDLQRKPRGNAVWLL